MPALARINVTVVKGTALQQVEQTVLTSNGIPGDRRFYLVDARDRLFTGAAHGQLVQVTSALESDANMLTCTFPDGTVARGPSDRLGMAHDTDFYGRSVAGHEVDGPFADAFSRFVGAPVRLIRCDRDGDGSDVYPVTVVSAASVVELARRGAHAGELDPLRFRMNLELDGCTPFEEDAWDGQRVRVGDAILRIHGQVPRCVVTTQDPRTGLHDWNTLKQIASFRPVMADRSGVPFGVYAQVEEAGVVRVGDDTAALDT
jgi:uncharacterized protein YcbX